MTDLRDKTAFITGGASGIGLALARALLAEGANTVIADVEAGALERARQTLDSPPDRLMTCVLDVTDRAAFADARDAAVDAMGGVHLVFNNAGVNAAGPVQEMTYQDFDWVLGVNLGGVVNGVVTFLPELQRHGSAAHLINTASVGGLLGMRSLSIYNASKFGVVGLSEALRADLEGTGIGVSVLCPGIIDTALASSERNRPEHLRNADAAPTPADSEAAPANPIAMSADEFAALALDAVVQDRFWVCSHPEFEPLVAQRNASVQSSFAGAPDPARVEAMGGLILPFET